MSGWWAECKGGCAGRDGDREMVFTWVTLVLIVHTTIDTHYACLVWIETLPFAHVYACDFDAFYVEQCLSTPCTTLISSEINDLLMSAAYRFTRLEASKSKFEKDVSFM